MSLIHSTGLLEECMKHSLSPRGSEHVNRGHIVTISPSVVDPSYPEAMSGRKIPKKAAFIEVIFK